jgi:hypothetical protein
MPSRKKAQGRARKAEKAKQAAETKRCTCMHSEARASWTEDEEKWAVEVSKEFVSKFTATLETKEGCVYTKELTLMASAIYTKYCQPFCERKIKILRELMVSEGTSICVIESKMNDLTEVSGIDMALMALPYAFMVQTFEVRNKYGGELDEYIQMETETPMAGLVCCPRETVKFFHRRNSCDCLQEIYYKLKERTKRVWVCATCC